MLYFVFAIFGVISLIIALANVGYTFINLLLIILTKDYIFYYRNSDGKEEKTNLSVDAFCSTVTALVSTDIGLFLLGVNYSVIEKISNLVRYAFLKAI